MLQFLSYLKSSALILPNMHIVKLDVWLRSLKVIENRIDITKCGTSMRKICAEK